MIVNASCLFIETMHSIPLATVLMAEFGIGLLGNGLALWIFCFCMKSWNPSTIYLFNLSLADFLLIFCLPLRAYYFYCTSDWHLGDIPCHIKQFMLSLNQAGSISFLTVVAGDRSSKVVHPFHKINSATKKEAVGIASLIWSMILAMTVHILAETRLVNEEVTNRTLCECSDFNERLSMSEIWNNIFFMAEFVMSLLPILFCTHSIVRQLKTRVDSQGRIQRTVRSVMFVSFEFIFCFLPSTGSTIAISISKGLNKCDDFKVACLVFVFAISLTYFNSVLNPVVFTSQVPRFEVQHIVVLFQTSSGNVDGSD